MDLVNIYLDYNATTPVDPRVVQAMIPTFEEKFGNPSSENHDTGQTAKSLVENARNSVANIVGMSKDDVIFTSGATEANNMVFSGYATNKIDVHILVSSTEHKSVLEPCKFLSSIGVTMIINPVTQDGILDLVALDDALLHKQIDIVSVMVANSETGVIQPIKAIAQRAHAHNALLHCDATQAIGKMPFNAQELGVDIVTFSSHKIYGPKGCGALVAPRHVRKRLTAILRGGGQEKDMRSGTLNVPAIVGFGKACEIAADEGLKHVLTQEKLRDDFEAKIIKTIPDVSINGKDAQRIPNTSNLRIKGALADAVIVNSPEIEISTGSACSSFAVEPSHVLTAMGLDTDAANESIRISLGRQTTQQDIDTAVNVICKAVQYVRGKEEEYAN